MLDGICVERLKKRIYRSMKLKREPWVLSRSRCQPSTSLRRQSATLKVVQPWDEQECKCNIDACISKKRCCKVVRLWVILEADSQ